MAPRRAEECPMKRVAAPGCRLPSRLPPGEILTDITQKEWKLGPRLGCGGFGDIYLASDDINKTVGQNAKYVIKIEPHHNGPLFVEMNFYIRVARQHMIDNWCKTQQINRISIPTYEGSGSYVFKGEKFRFLVIPRYGIDVGKLFLSNGRKLPTGLVNNLAIQMLDSLEYIHSHGYAHADVKGSNIVLEVNGENVSENPRAYLVDYGLAYRFCTRAGVHKPFLHDERRAHEGTLEFTSRDAHHGTHSRRGDMETLGYNILQWLCGKLPWEQEGGGMRPFCNPEEVHAQKESLLSDIPLFMRECFPKKKKPPVGITEYMKYIASLDFEAKPNYTYLRNLFHRGGNKIERNSSQSTRRKRISDENISCDRPIKMPYLRERRPCKPVNGEGRITRNTQALVEIEEFSWEEVLARHPDKLAKVSSQVINTPLTPPPSPPPPSLPTYAMLHVLQRMKDRQSGAFKQKSKPNDHELKVKWMTPAMEEVAQLKKNKQTASTATKAPNISQRLTRSRVAQLKRTSTDLVPQLLGMFDELARKGDGSNGEQQQQQQQQQQYQQHQQHIPAAIQKRLSLVASHSQRNSIFGHICTSNNSMQSQQQQPQSQDQTTMLPRLDATNSKRTMSSHVEITVCNAEKENENENTIVQDCNNDDDKSIYRCKMTGGGLMPEYNNRRRKHLDRPLSGSSIASSTSSSGCSNQGNAGSANPYLASVESLADTCASSQGSGDSGVVTTSEAICRIRDNVNQRRNSIVDNSSPLICHRARYCDSQRNPVERVLLEIVDTEAIYVEHLRQVIQGYLIFWRDDPAGLLQQLQLIHLFSNIEDIFRFNREFLKEIEACGLNPVMVANTFTKHNAGFKVYTEYCTNYPRTVSVLTDLMGRNDTAKAFRERQAALGHALPLGSFLLKPVQRILKYHLLLENLSKEYEADETQLNMQEGKNAIEEALATMTGIAKHINAMKRRHEHAVRVQEIQSLLYGWPGPDLTTSGELVAEGRFRMRGAKAPRHAFLFERMLLLTKKKEDGLLVYKAHIMCSNLMLIESIPGEPCSFHVIPFDNPRLQYTLQARNLEQKREWTLQIKRVMLENYNAVIPSHARQLVLQLGQTHHDDDTTSDRGSMKKQYSSPPEYLERRKQEKERRRSEAGLRQKAKKSNGKNDNSTTVENSPATSRKNPSAEDQSVNSNSNRDRSLNRSLDGRASKVKDRFTNWRRKSEPGFQSYVSLNQSDDELNDSNNLVIDSPSPITQIEVTNIDSINDTDTSQTHNTNVNSTTINSSTVTNTKDVNEQQTHVRTVEEIVGHILMQNEEFQRLLEKQRNNSLANVRQQQRFKKHQRSIDTSDDSDIGEQNYSSELLNSSNNTNIINNINSRINRSTRIARREHRLVRTNNAWNSLSSVQSRDNNTNLQLQYNNLRTENEKVPIADVNSKNKVNHRVYEKRAMFEAFKRQSIVTDSKIIKTALRIREHSVNDEINDNNNTDIVDNIVMSTKDIVNADEKTNETIVNEDNSDTTGFGNYDNLQHVWDGLTSDNRRNEKSNDSPTRPAVWLTKLCDDLPTSPQKSGSLPRSFQISPNPQEAITKARFLQRDGKPMSERPFTIASDKPAEINLEDMERYASSYQPEGRIAKFPISASSTSSTFFYSLDDNLTDIDSDVQTTTASVATTTTTATTTAITMSATTVTGNNIHPDHKIYRANVCGSTMLKNVLSKAGSRLQGLRSTVSAETLECVEDFGRSTSYSRFYGDMKIKKKKSKLRLSRESSTDIDEPAQVGCIPAANSTLQIPSLYYKQGSSGLGARIAQADYADPSVLFFDTKRSELNLNESTLPQSSTKNQMVKVDDNECDEKRDRIGSDGDGYYEKCFETIENYIDTEADDTFRDSAIFSDAEEIISAPQIISTTASTTSTTTTATSLDVNESNVSSRIKVKIAPPVPIKRKSKIISNNLLLLNKHKDDNTNKPSIALKPIDFKSRPKLVRGKTEFITSRCLTVAAVSHEEITKPILSATDERMNISNNLMLDDRNDVSAGQSQAGWVKKMVGQLQAQIET